MDVVTWKCGEIFLILSSEMWFNKYIGIDSRGLANGYPLCTCVSPSIYYVPFTALHIHQVTLYKISPKFVNNREWEVLR